MVSAGLEEFLQPDGVTVIEWAERWFGKQRTSNNEHRISNLENVRRVKIEIIGEMERRFVYDDFGA
jgi:tRNA A37 threonylcarbamoyladenosine biosynthesis protein TsaE